MQDETLEQYRRRLTEAKAKREAAQAALREAEADVQVACESAVSVGLTLSQVGELLGCSKQAVSQLVKRVEKRDRDAYEWEQYKQLDDRRAMRALAVSERGLERRAFPCLSCGRFKSKPADECGYCGDTPLTHNGDEHELNRAYGYGY
jgi:DNA-binding MarR family transcriptional regulator